jgi:FSR family fosmidomycin resistance protein-like MFS transporter
LGFLYSLNYNKYLACILFILTGFFILLSVGVILVQAQRSIPELTGVVSGVMQGFSWGLGALFLAPLGIIGQNYGVDKILILMGTIAFIVGLLSIKTKMLKN